MWMGFEHLEEFIAMEELGRYLEFINKRLPPGFHGYCAVCEGAQVALVRAR